MNPKAEVLVIDARPHQAHTQVTKLTFYQKLIYGLGDLDLTFETP